MAGSKNKRLQGIVIDIGGNTSELSKALTEPNKEAKDLKDKLKEVDTALKFDPTNVELLAQKQDLLGQSVDKTKDKLNLLKQAQKEFKDSGGDLNSSSYIQLQADIAKTEQALKDLQDQQTETNAGFQKMATQIGDFGNKASEMGNKIKGVSVAAGGAATAMIATVEATKEYREDLSKLDANARQAGSGLDATHQALKDLNAITGEADSNVEALSNLMEAGFTDNNLLSVVDSLSGAVIKFPDTLKIESLSDSLQETIATGQATGQFAELLGRLGINTEEFSEKLDACTTASQRQQLAMSVLSTSGLSELNQAYRENNESLIDNSNAQFDLNQQLANLAANIEPVIAMITQGIADILGWFNQLSPEIQQIILIILMVVAASAPLLMMIGSIATGISALLPLIAAGTAAISGVIAPVLLVIGVITALIAIGVALYENWDYICAKAQEIWNNICSTVGGFVGNVYTAIKDGIQSAIDYLTSLPSKAIQWGKDFIGGFVDGIKDMAGSVVNAVSGVADTITSWLHFSRPDVGPLREYETWMPDFMQGMADGIYNNKGVVESAISSLANSMIVDPSLSSSVNVNTQYGESNTGMLNTLLDKISTIAQQPASTGSNQLVFPIYLGNKMLDEVIYDANARLILKSGGH